jgi:hypothetical protein
VDRLRTVGGVLTVVVGLVAVLTTVSAYVVCVRWGCWRWLAVAAGLPVLVQIRVLSEQPPRAVFALLMLALGLVTVSWRARTGPVGLAASGVVLTLGGALLAIGAPVHAGLHIGRSALLVMAVVGVAAALGLGRSAALDLRLVCGATAVAGATGGVGWLLAWPVSGALGLTALLRGARGRGTHRPQQDAVDELALTELRETRGALELGPVAIVIAAYNEAAGIPAVLASLPTQVCGLHADVVVVDDGSTDGTPAALTGSRAVVVSCPVNRGQGAALRLGYRVAREHGAAYVVTTDADGQYSTADMDTVLSPILDGRADFVTGSRILGHQTTRDRVRRVGVHVFAWLATALTGRRLTDTSFGLRAMRAEVTAAVTLNQPQYQSSELLLGALSHGFRVVEVPASMNLRSAGTTKKGRNLVYGRRYARAMLGTWCREGAPRPVTETAPALRQTRGHGD